MLCAARYATEQFINRCDFVHNIFVYVYISFADACVMSSTTEKRPTRQLQTALDRWCRSINDPHRTVSKSACCNSCARSRPNGQHLTWLDIEMKTVLDRADGTTRTTTPCRVVYVPNSASSVKIYTTEKYTIVTFIKKACSRKIIWTIKRGWDVLCFHKIKHWKSPHHCLVTLVNKQ